MIHKLHCNADGNVDITTGGGTPPETQTSQIQVEGGALDLTGGDDHVDTTITQDTPPPKTNLAPKTTSEIPAELKGNEPIGDISKEFEDDNIITPDKLQLEAKQIEDAKKTKAAEELANKTKAQEQANVAKQRDYSIFDQQIVPQLKKLPNEQFAIVDKLQRSNKELSTKLEDATKGIVKLPDTYIEHPDAWRFSPEVPKFLAQKKQCQNASRHYTDCLAKIAAGEAWQDITGYDEKGNPILSEPIEVKDTTEADKVAMLTTIQKADRYSEEADNQLNALRNNHIQNVTKLRDGIKQQMLSAYPWMDANAKDDKGVVLQSSKFNKLDKDGKLVETTVADTIKMFRDIIPVELRNTPLAEPLVATLTANIMLQDLARLNTQKQQVSQQLKVDTKAAEPQLNGKSTTKARASDSELIGSVADMREDD